MLDIYNEATLIGVVDYGDKYLRLSYDEQYAAMP